MQVINYKKLELTNISFQDPVKTSGGCLISKTVYKHRGSAIPILIQTPKLKVVNDVEVLDYKTFIELELDKRHINFYEFINNIDDLNISKTFQNSEDWFGEKLPMDVVDDFYKTNIKMPKFNKSPIIKFKIPIYKNNARRSCNVFGDDLKPVSVSEIKKNTEVICILELEGIKFFKQRFETEWKVLQLRVYNEPKEPIPYLINEQFLSDAEDNSSNIDLAKDPFPEYNLSLNSSIESNVESINENTLVVNESKQVDEEKVKNISITVGGGNENKNTNLVTVEKVKDNISLEITSCEEQPSKEDNIETPTPVEVAEVVEPIETTEPTEIKEVKEEAVEVTEEKAEAIEVAEEKPVEVVEVTEEKPVEVVEVETTELPLEKEPISNVIVNDTSKSIVVSEKPSMIEDNNLEGETSFTRSVEEEEVDVSAGMTSENEYSSEEDSELDSDIESNGDILDDYYSDNFTDEEEICDGLENNLEEISFLPKTSFSEPVKNEVIESMPEEIVEPVSQTNIDNEYQNKTMEELISEINRFKKIATDRENEMSELKSKYRNLYSELKL